MSTTNPGARTHLANAVITAYQAVVLSTNGGVGLNGTSTKPDGIALTDTASGGYVAVNYMHADGSAKCESAVSVIAIGGTLYAGAGIISSTGTVVVGKALEACTVTGSVIEFIPNTL